AEPADGMPPPAAAGADPLPQATDRFRTDLQSGGRGGFEGRDDPPRRARAEPPPNRSIQVDQSKHLGVLRVVRDPREGRRKAELDRLLPLELAHASEQVVVSLERVVKGEEQMA